MTTRFFLAVCAAREMSRDGFGLASACQIAGHEHGIHPEEIGALVAEAEIACARARADLLAKKLRRLGATEEIDE